MMSRDRVYTLNEARTGAPAPARPRSCRERAEELPGDPPWLHEGKTLRLTVRGEAVDFFGISVVATGVGKSTGTVRRWIAQGLLPEPPYRTPSRYVCAQARLWTRQSALETAAAVKELGLTGRRPQRWEGSPLRDRLQADAGLR